MKFYIRKRMRLRDIFLPPRRETINRFGRFGYSLSDRYEDSLIYMTKEL